MACLAKVTVILAGDVSSNQLPLAGSQRARPMEEHMCELAHRLSGFGAKSKTGSNARQSFRKSDVRHSSFSLVFSTKGTALAVPHWFICVEGLSVCVRTTSPN